VGYGRAAFEVQEGRDVEGLELRLKPFGTLAGIVREKQTQQPLAGIPVMVGGGGWEDGLAAVMGEVPPATSDTEGRFRITDLIPGLYRVGIWAEGYQCDDRPTVPVSAVGEPAEVVIELQGGSPVRGQVLDADGQPLAGAAVRIGPQERTTDEQGRFEFASVIQEDFRDLYQGFRSRELIAEARGRAPRVQALELAGPDQPVELTLILREMGGTVAGQVRSAETGEPLGGALVWAMDAPQPPFSSEQEDFLHPYFYSEEMQDLRDWFEPWQWDWMGLPRCALGLTDVEGRYQLAHVPPGRYTVYAFVSDHGPGVREGLTVSEGLAAQDVDFSLTPQEKKPLPLITGRITGPDGEPLAYTSVPYEISLPEGRYMARLETDGAGRYAIEMYEVMRSEDRNQPFNMAIQPEGFRIARRENLRWNGNGRIENVDFRLAKQPEGTLTGRVFLPDGRTPAVGVWVLPVVRERSWPDLGGASWTGLAAEGVWYEAGADRATVTDAEGRYRIAGLEVGDFREYGLYALLHYRQVEVLGWADTLSLPEPPPEAPPPDPRLVQAASTLSGLVPVAADQEVELNLTLGPAGSLVGTVRAIEDGQPMLGMEVLVVKKSHFENGFLGGGSVHHFGEGHFGGWSGSFPEQDFLAPRLSATTDAAGRFRLEGLMPGPYRITAEWPGWHDYIGEVAIRPGEETALEIRMRKGAE
jgi:protocatechuate 3,4-dioxygenase beta subunit